MPKIIPIEQYRKERRGHNASDDPPKAGFFKNIIRDIKEALAFIPEESDEQDDWYER